jgi:hypothetical protein
MTSAPRPVPTSRLRDWLGKLITFWTLIVLVSAIAIGVFADLGEDVAARSTTQFDNAGAAVVHVASEPFVYKLAYAITTWIGPRS